MLFILVGLTDTCLSSKPGSCWESLCTRESTGKMCSQLDRVSYISRVFSGSVSRWQRRKGCSVRSPTVGEYDMLGCPLFSLQCAHTRYILGSFLEFVLRKCILVWKWNVYYVFTQPLFPAMAVWQLNIVIWVQSDTCCKSMIIQSDKMASSNVLVLK